MPKHGFKRNAATVRKILMTHDGGKRAAVQRMYDRLPEDVKAESRIEVYQTDREVVGLVVPADRQARDGAGTRAAQSVANGDD
ncbi:hypothetical protein KL864_27045 [Mycolicibacterium goodii]|uniref:hypothetical protein n=1 Tax=Mycolicibacterium goodii TaxID=134601 RepID=UPI001BDDAF5A|nr:hypothetical protein [Mycolicibacterium goodii]MBU8819547.1 hypothetical protein [Mycolicibacterium goodii]